MAPLTAAEVLAHPAFQHLEWNLPPTKQGKCEVAKGRSGGPFKLHYEVHGTGKTKLVWIMGLGAFRTAWKRQTKYFGHDRTQTYSSLVFDNRGMGLSDKPSSRYTTTEMAKDIIDLLNYLQWLPPPRSSSSGSSTIPYLNIIGVSMGGMIAQELALLLPPSTINSLFLISTAPRLVRTVPFVENLRQRINMFIPRDIDVQLDEIAHRLFSEQFLAQPDTEAEVMQFHADVKREDVTFPSIRDRFAAGELSKRRDVEGFTRKGFILQAIAAGWHHKSTTQLKELGDRIGRDRIAVVHGTLDRMITFRHAELFKEELGERIEWRVWEGRGHVLMWEEEKGFNLFVEEFVNRCEHLNA